MAGSSTFVCGYGGGVLEGLEHPPRRRDGVVERLLALGQLLRRQRRVMRRRRLGQLALLPLELGHELARLVECGGEQHVLFAGVFGIVQVRDHGPWIIAERSLCWYTACGLRVWLF